MTVLQAQPGPKDIPRNSAIAWSGAQRQPIKGDSASDAAHCLPCQILINGSVPSAFVNGEGAEYSLRAAGTVHFRLILGRSPCRDFSCQGVFNGIESLDSTLRFSTATFGQRCKIIIIKYNEFYREEIHFWSCPCRTKAWALARLSCAGLKSGFNRKTSWNCVIASSNCPF